MSQIVMCQVGFESEPDDSCDIVILYCQSNLINSIQTMLMEQIFSNKL